MSYQDLWRKRVLVCFSLRKTAENIHKKWFTAWENSMKLNCLKWHRGGSIKTLLLFAKRKTLFPEANSNKRMEEGAENLKASESQYPFPDNKSVRNTAHTLWTQGKNNTENPALFHALFKEKAIRVSFFKISVKGLNSTQERSLMFLHKHI